MGQLTTQGKKVYRKQYDRKAKVTRSSLLSHCFSIEILTAQIEGCKQEMDIGDSTAELGLIEAVLPHGCDSYTNLITYAVVN